MLFAGCSSDSPNDSQSTHQDNKDEINLNAQVWQVMQASAPRRAQTFDNAAALQEQGSFTASAYVENTATKYINPVQVNWNTGTGKWVWSDGKHYWPASGNLDFFAYYMPATVPTYITGPTYSIVESHPQASFTCSNMPMIYNAATPAAGQGSSLQEFVWGITVGQNKAAQGASGVTMKFRHPFARIKFQLAANHPNIIINSITFKNLKTGGTCTLTNKDIAESYYYTKSVWSELTGSSDLVMQLVAKDNEGKYVMTNNTGEIIVNNAAKFYSNPASVVPIGGWAESAHQYVNLLVIPQTFAGVIEVNAGWNDWGDTPVEHTVTTTIPSITWQPGYSYTYTFTITLEDLVVNLSDFTEQW
jgi:hypothetical protein